MSHSGPVEFLIKKGTSKSWKKMTASISGGKFMITNPANEAVVDVPLGSATVTSGSEGSHKFVITVDDGKKKHLFAVKTKEEMDEWVASFGHRPAPKLTIDDFDPLAVVGRGGFGKVQLYRHKESGKIYVIKKMSKAELAESDMLQRTILEKEVLLQIDHPFVVKAHFTFQNVTDVFIGMEYVPGGELYERLKQAVPMPVDTVRLYTAQLALAVGYLHSQGIIHRDLKPENVLFDRDGYIKITDFGLAKRLDPSQGTKTFCGTPDYIAPEMIRGQSYGAQVDWWSIGCLAYEMLIGQPPFYDQDAMTVYRAAIKEDVKFPPQYNFAPEVTDCLLQLLTKDPAKRLGANGDLEEVKRHPFFAPINWADLEAKKIAMPWKPAIKSETDVSQYDAEFTTQSTDRTYHDPSQVTASVQEQFVGFSCVQGDVISGP